MIYKNILSAVLKGAATALGSVIITEGYKVLLQQLNRKA